MYLKEFLVLKGIDVVAVETLTRDEVLPNVRTKTFKVTVKPAQYEKALDPDVWPYRVAVRHYRQPKRQDSTWSGQSGRTGGQVDRGNQGGARNRQPQPVRNFPVGHQQYRQSQQQVMEHCPPESVQFQNLFDVLGRLGSAEVQLQ